MCSSDAQLFFTAGDKMARREFRLICLLNTAGHQINYHCTEISGCPSCRMATTFPSHQIDMCANDQYSQYLEHNLCIYK